MGVDRVVAEAGVAKATLYRHFRSKDELVVAFLRRRDGRWRDWLRSAVERLAPRPADRPLAVFDALGEWFASDDFRGCAFINAAAEIADPDHPARAAVEDHERLLGADLEDILRMPGPPTPPATPRRCGARFGTHDVYLNVAGGYRITEPAADLAVAAALVSSLCGLALPADCVYFGEISLSGAIRPVAHAQQRLKEAEKLGFGRAVLPRGSEELAGNGAVFQPATLADLVGRIAGTGPPPDGRLTDGSARFESGRRTAR